MWQNALSFVILCLFFYGRSLRKKNIIAHAKMMTFVISLDLTLVVYLVLRQKALAKIGTDMNKVLFIHIPFAVVTVICYLAALAVGRHLLRGEKQYLRSMRLIDRIVVPCRILNFVTSVWLYLNSQTG